MAEMVPIVILNWNNWRDTVECLESVFQSSYPDFQVVVIDNASEDDSEGRMRKWARDRSIPHVRYDRGTAERGGDSREEEKLRALLPPSLSHPMIFIQTGENLGYAGGNNVGLKYVMARGGYRFAWLLNNDTVVDRDALTEMVALADADARTGMVGSKLLYHHMPDVLHMAGGVRIIPWMGNAAMIANGRRETGRWDRTLELDYVGSASLPVKREVIEEVGLMEEQYFLYREDADWGMRARERGSALFQPPLRISPIGDFTKCLGDFSTL